MLLRCEVVDQIHYGIDLGSRKQSSNVEGRAETLVAVV